VLRRIFKENIRRLSIPFRYDILQMSNL
jgi:hypothetical protein